MFNTPNTVFKQLMISVTQRLREKNSEISPFLASVTNSHKTYMLSGRVTSSTIMVKMMNTLNSMIRIIPSEGRIYEEFIALWSVSLKLLRRKIGRIQKKVR